MYHAWYTHGIHQCYAWNSPYHAWNYAWYMHEDTGKIHACFRPVPCLPVPVKRPNSLHVPVLSHETCMVHAHYALQDHAISMHEIM